MSEADVKARRTQVERRAATRAALVESAVACINTVGAASVSTAQIAAEAGVTRGAVQHQFGTPEELYLAVVKHGWEEIAAMYRKGPDTNTPVDRRIKGWAKTLVDAYTGPAALAGYEMLLYYRGNADFVARQVPLALAAEAELDGLWVDAFADTRLGRARLVGIRHAARTFMLGAVARSFMVPETDAHLRREVADLLRAFLPAQG